MTTVKVAAVEPLRRESVQEILRSGGPCISLFLQPYRQGEHSATAQGVLKSDVQEAARLLTELKTGAPAIEGLLDPLHELAKDPELASGHQWARAIFRSPETFRQFLLPESISHPISVSGCFHIRPLLAQLHFPQEFHLLTLSKKGVSLFHCSGPHARKIALPPGVVATLEEMLAMEAPDHDLENRKAAGSSVGAMKGVRFGTGQGRETQSAYLADYYKSVDRGMTVFLHGRPTPLVLVGVEQDIAIYQKVNTYPNLLRHVVLATAWMVSLDPELMIRGAYAIVRSDYVSRETKSLNEAKERTSPTRFTTGLHAILLAAFEGRVGRLYINDDARSVGVFERGHYRSFGAEDLPNLAAVQTLLHGGDAGAARKAYAPKNEVAAVLRF